ncbi:MAG: hypothetical protein RL685_7594 [Pseudomonadota bacterium]
MSDNRSLIYAHPSLYQLLMRVIYAGGYAARYQALSQLIPDGADVFEACAGDAYLYRHYLQPRGIRYRAGEFNETFVTHARARGIEMQRFDLRKDPVPQADVVLIHASLYQFMPDHQQIIDRLLAAARQQLIVSEPVRNLSSSRWALIRWIASRSADPGSGHKAQRFDEASFDQFVQAHYADRVRQRVLIPGGRELIYCLEGRAR